jgi:hypothetical protein
MLLPFVIMPSLLVRTIMDLLIDIIIVYSASISDQDAYNIRWVSIYLYPILTMAISLAVAVIAMQKPIVDLSRKNGRGHVQYGPSNWVSH